MGTGIVFVVLVAIWVVYFVQYWSRRREHLATARSVEAFAEAMRVLERRPALRAPAGSRVSSAYAMSPARVVSARPVLRPQVIAKPHSATPPPRTTSSQRGGAPRMSTPTVPRRPARTRPPRTHAATAHGGMSPSRKVRGLALLGSLLATLVVVGLAAFSVLLWWVPIVGLAVVGASFLWLRSGVQAEISTRRAGARRRPAQPGRGQRVPVRRGAARPASAAGATGRGPTETSGHEPLTGSAKAVESGHGDGGHIEAGDGAGPLGSTVDQDPDAWRPVPVPPPTYTLKAKAERPAPPAPEVTAAEPTPRAAEGEPDAGRTAAYGT